MGVRLQALMLFTAYLASITAARYNPAGLEQALVSKSIRAATSVSFGLLAIQLHLWGSLDQWPNILPLAIIFGAAAGASVILDALITRPMPDNVRHRYDSLGWVVAAASFVGVSFYVMSPPEEGWMRPTGLLLFICFALPLLFAAGQLGRHNQGSPEKGLVDIAFEASNAAYLKTRTQKLQDTEFVHNRDTGSRVGVSTYDGNVLVAFSGSKSKTDWLKTNTNAATAEFRDKVYVHKGFLEAWKSVKEDVWKLVTDAMLRNAGAKRVIVCGHSLGGAQATIAALDLYDELDEATQKNLTVITFGSPQVGTAPFAKLFDATIPHSIRIYTVFDPVPKVAAQFVHVKGGTAITTPGTDNPATAHNLDTYASALVTPSYAAVIPAAIVVVLLGMSACVPRERIERVARVMINNVRK